MKRLIYLVLWLICFILLVYLLRYPVPSLSEPSDVVMPLVGKVIVLDPGHGGVDGGADYGDVKEKSIVLNTTIFLRDYLRQAGAEVHLTRETDKDLAPKDMKGYSKRKAYDIRKRVDFIKHHDADIIVSLHLNSLVNERWKGGQTFYYPGDTNEALAKAIQERIREVTETNRQAFSTSNIYILKKSETTGALVELGFLSNAQERKRLLTEDYQRELAFAVYQGIVEYVHGEQITSNQSN
ncbi:N-acetylmuramoyl-L-alanine amidase CwlD [Filobacillus milosensis]|uniref:N-acetylmuramoyl-L-alanine amidase CwlD n=1 Tax=Filobacillus milosensis TaxID=94137 RepID=A0A4Y8IET6_9BACI|nr:N-acetylmuramoyl-L-alanine amidase [Filobacillus milosensis]TFB14670.1 N-acetylmuramoyl-L-alanine amidase CwlD [Filobacillus milosensis]